MLIGGLIALFSLLLGSDGMPFLIPEEEKAIKKVIVDKDTRKKLKALFKEVEVREKAYKKDRKDFLKLLDKITKEQQSTPEDFAKMGRDFQQKNAEVYDFMVKIRIKLGSYITDKEWSEIIENGKKEFYKADKDFEKVYPKFEKDVKKLNNRIAESMTNQETVKLIQKRLLNFSSLTLKNAKSLNTYNVYENEVYNDIHSSIQELEAVSDELLILRSEVFDEYVKIHQLIANNSTPEEWQKVVKHLNKLF